MRPKKDTSNAHSKILLKVNDRLFPVSRYAEDQLKEEDDIMPLFSPCEAKSSSNLGSNK